MGKLSDDASEYVDAHINDIRLIYSQYSMSTERTWRMSADKIAKHVAKFASQYNHPANTEQEIKAIVMAMGFVLRSLEHLSFIASRVKMNQPKPKPAPKPATKVDKPKPATKENKPKPAAKSTTAIIKRQKTREEIEKENEERLKKVLKETEEFKKQMEEEMEKGRKELEEQEKKWKKGVEERKARHKAWKASLSEEERARMKAEKEARRKKEKEEHDEMLEDTDNYMSEFMSRHTIYKQMQENAAEMSGGSFNNGLNKAMEILFPDIRNDQQKVCYSTAYELFKKDTGHTLTLEEFKEIADRYPHNFVDTLREQFKLADERWHKFEMNNRVSRQMYEAKEAVDQLAKEYANTKKRALKHQVRITDFGHAIKHSEVNQYPRRFTTSTPTPIVNITSADKPKLNLSHMHQVDQPESVTPSENTRAPSHRIQLDLSNSEHVGRDSSGRIQLDLSHSEHVGRDNHIDYSIGVIRGVEADDRIYKKEVDPYALAICRLRRKNMLDKLPRRNSPVHATALARDTVGTLGGRLTAWR